MENVNNLNGVSNFGHGEGDVTPEATPAPVEEVATPEVPEETETIEESTEEGV